jgi:predicted 3-demethylubiquinone-9 3-methyltransferase (glyoxalase superfamily)
MPPVTPMIWLDTESEEAAEFYVSVFPNSRITEISRYGEAGPRPAGMTMVVRFLLDGREFSALNGGSQYTPNEAISLVISCADQDEVDHYWTRLSEGGEEGPCGWLRDRFGVWWQVVPAMLERLLTDPDAGRRERAMRAMLGMGKLDVAALEAATEGRA